MYEIKVLSNEEFNNVAKSDPRYEYVDETNMGFADREKGIAYVRGTHLHDLNKYLINHELEELESDESTHEDPNGIRHKKFFKEIILPIFSSILGAVPGVGPILSGGFSALTNKLGGGGESQQQPQPPVIPTEGSYAPSNLSQFNVPGTDRIPEPTSGSYQPNISFGGLGGGLESLGQGVGGLSPEILERLKGSSQGRLVF